MNELIGDTLLGEMMTADGNYRYHMAWENDDGSEKTFEFEQVNDPFTEDEDTTSLTMAKWGGEDILNNADFRATFKKVRQKVFRWLKNKHSIDKDAISNSGRRRRDTDEEVDEEIDSSFDDFIQEINELTDGTFNPTLVNFGKANPIIGPTTTVTKNNLYQTIPTLYKQWSLTVDIMPTGLEAGYSNILHLGSGQDFRDGFRDGTPGIWFQHQSTKLLITSEINGETDFHAYGTTPAIPMNKWTRVEVSQLRQIDGSYQFTIVIAGEIFVQLTNNNPKEFSNVKVYTASNNYNTAKAMITNPIISTSHDGN